MLKVLLEGGHEFMVNDGEFEKLSKVQGVSTAATLVTVQRQAGGTISFRPQRLVAIEKY